MHIFYIVYLIFLTVSNPNASAPPGPPNVMAQTIGPDMVRVVVSPSPNGGRPTSYNVSISNSSYTSSPVVMANGSAVVTFAGLRNVSTYNISAVAINCAGNTITESYISCMYTGLVQMSVCTQVWKRCVYVHVYRFGIDVCMYMYTGLVQISVCTQVWYRCVYVHVCRFGVDVCICTQVRGL